jgi:FlaA1/EpsC-like NDP-sugar epimerase
VESITERRSQPDPPARAPGGEAGGVRPDAPRDDPAPPPPATATHVGGRHRFRHRRPAWLRRHVQVLAVVDALAAVLATWLAKMVSFGTGPAELHLGTSEVPYAALMLVSVPTWVAVMATSRCYDVGPFGTGNGEPRRVVSAAAHFLAVMAVAYYVAHLENLGRGFLIAIVPLAAVLTLAGRAVARAQLRVQHAAGRAVRRAAVVGSPDSARLLLDHLAADPHGGVVPVAALTPGGAGPVPFAGRELPVIGDPDDAYRALARSDADLLIVTGPYAPGRLRRLAWQLEGTGVDVLVAPTVGQLPGPQHDVRPVAGLPLLYVDRTRWGVS